MLRRRVGEHRDRSREGRDTPPTDELVARPAQQRAYASKAPGLGRVVAADAVVLVIDGEALALPGRTLADEAPPALREVEGSVLVTREPVGGFGAPLV